MPTPPTAAMDAIAHCSLRVTGLRDIEPPKNVGTDPLTATVTRGDGIPSAASAAVWTQHREDEFRRLLAHKLRNPLAPIVTCVQILQSRAPQDRLLHHALDLMDRQLTRLVHMLDELCHADTNGACDPMPEAQPTKSGFVNAGGGEAGGLNGHRTRGRALDGVSEGTNDTVNLQLPFNSKQRVLIVDDNLDAAEALRLLLCIKGFEVFTACDGMEAIRRTKECAPDVILMDLEMPTMDGCEAARRIHAIPDCEAIPIVALTGLDHDCDRERSRQSGMVEHLVKPVEVAAVQEVLRSLIPGAQLCCNSQLPGQ
jgi:CheY-like chemotaxis protein